MRHLIFHLTPLATPPGQRCWRWHLRQINHYEKLFDGKRVFAINVGPEFTPVDQILPILPPRSEVILIPNHPELREVYSLPLLLSRVYTLSQADQVFYAHGKGISWVGHEKENMTRWWSLAMYRFLLNEPALTASLNNPMVGWLKFEGPPPNYFPSWSLWHYVGTFFWFRAGDVFSRPWWYITPARYGAEAYPSSLFESKFAVSKYTVTPQQHFLPSGDSRIYTMEFWNAMGVPVGTDALSYDGSPD